MLVSIDVAPVGRVAGTGYDRAMGGSWEQELLFTVSTAVGPVHRSRDLGRGAVCAGRGPAKTKEREETLNGSALFLRKLVTDPLFSFLLFFFIFLVFQQQ